MRARGWLAAATVLGVAPALAAAPGSHAQRGGAVPASNVARAAQDVLRPAAHIEAPRYASDSGRGPRFLLRVYGEDRGSGLSGLTLETRRESNASNRWRRLGGAATERTLRFPGRPGETHSFRVRARDGFGNFSRYAYGSTTVPLDDRSPRLRFSRGWRTTALANAYRRTLHRTERRGATVRLRFRGDRVALIARRTRSAGRLRLEVDGRARTVSLRGRGAARQVIFRSSLLGPSIHRLTVTALGGGPVNLDAVATERGVELPR